MNAPTISRKERSQRRHRRASLWVSLILLTAVSFPSRAIDSAETETQLKLLRDQNRILQEQLQKQQQTIDSLSAKVSSLQETREKSDSGALVSSAPSSVFDKVTAHTKVNVSGQIAAGLFETGSHGQFPNSEFRVDEARLFFDAQAWEDVYGYVELNLTTRENNPEGDHLGEIYPHIGEVYVDFERLLKFRSLEGLVNVRAGRFYIPFGEEYQARYAFNNPLISHSLSDIWGVDEGIELYGSYSKFQYAVAVQNGGHSVLHDFTGDKSVAGRIGYTPVQKIHLSLSGMRTGDLSSRDDQFSETWFGNGFFRSLGGEASTSRFHANMVEGDFKLDLPRSYVKGAGGYIAYGDNDSAGNNHRDLFYYYAEGLGHITPKFYGVTRFSQIMANQGFPIVANGDFGQYLFRSMTDDIWRLSFGLGYEPNPNLVLKIEYTIERGREIGGQRRSHEDFAGAEIALKF
ncbi:MAG: hypothetical protein JWM99_784 [Verrucomicrobiales bacterium]|nr:hypothetical protein [Verrucomicrobiales bacterium]